MDLWVDLKLNWCISIQYIFDSGVVYHKSVLCNVLAYGMSLVLKKGTPAAITNYYETLLTHFPLSKDNIYIGIGNIIPENPLIKVTIKYLPVTNQLLTSQVESQTSLSQTWVS